MISKRSYKSNQVRRVLRDQKIPKESVQVLLTSALSRVNSGETYLSVHFSNNFKFELVVEPEQAPEVVKSLKPVLEKIPICI